MNKVLVVHFTHPEGYPPALNAINCLAEKVDTITVVTTDTLPTHWSYKENVNFELVEGEHDRFSFVKKPVRVKVKRYFSFISKIRESIKNDKPDLVITYDNVPFLLYLFATLFLSQKNHKLWNHNHDIYPASRYTKGSINWFSYYAIQRFLNRLDYFSIPSMERVKMFPMHQFKGKFFYIPNYPSKKIIDFIEIKGANWTKEQTLKLVYPGSPSFKNGFEELLDVMISKVNDKTVTLTLVGETNEKYKKELTSYAVSKGVQSQLYFESRVAYTEMPNFLKNYHIGWGLYKPTDLSKQTAATSSNKIYEFLANAMPIVVFDNEHHRRHLSDTAATFFCDLSKKSIYDVLLKIDNQYESLSAAARFEFESKYQFEQSFNKARDEILG